MSPDLVHDQPFAEYVTTKVIEQYKAKFELEGRTLKHVHIWSDGCKGQFKNKDQFLFVTQVFLRMFSRCRSKLSVTKCEPATGTAPVRGSNHAQLLCELPRKRSFGQRGDANIELKLPVATPDSDPKCARVCRAV
jgi:hypothetical protein